MKPFNEKLILLCLLLIMAVGIVYGQVHPFGLITRDDFITVKYPETYPKLLSRPMSVFTTPMPESAFFWIPVSGLSLLTDVLICPPGYSVMHVTNVIFHACNSIILFLLLGYLTKKIWPGFVAALIFAVHPLNVETVVVISNRTTLLSMMFWMLTLVAYIYYAQKPSPGRYGLMMLFFILGLMAKPSIAGYVFLLPLLDIWPLRRYSRQFSGGVKSDEIFPAFSTRKLLVEKVPIFSMAAGWAAMTGYFFMRIPFYHSPLFVKARMEVLDRIINVPVSYFGYVYKFIIPVRLNYFTPAPPLRDFPISHGLGAFLAVFAVTFFILLVLRKHKPLVVGWLWFLIGITPAAVANALMQNFITSRYAYLPMIGLAITGVWGVSIISERLPLKRKFAGNGVLMVVVLIFLCLAWAQVGRWKDLTSLYRHAISIDPDKGMLHLNLGRELYQKGDVDQAILHFKAAQTLSPANPEPYINLGLTCLARHEPHRALAYFEKGWSVQPHSIIINENLVTLYIQQKRYAEAVALLKQLLIARPDYAVSITYHLAVVYAYQDDVENARYWLQESIRKNPAVIAAAEKEPAFDKIRGDDCFLSRFH